MTNSVDFKAMAVDLRDRLTSSEANNAELLDALCSVEEEMQLLRWMKNCELRRGRGSFGIAVMSDEQALEWQAHDRRRRSLEDRRLAAIAKARGEA